MNDSAGQTDSAGRTDSAEQTDSAEPTRRHRIAVVGAGGVSEMHFDGFRLRPERIDVVAVIDPSPERREWAVSTYGVPSAFASIAEALAAVEFDVAVVCTPSHVRLETVRELAAAGKHLLVEKPFADGIDEARELVRITDEAGVQLAVDQNFREHYGFELARELIQAGRVGRVRVINHRELMHRVDEGWRNDQPHHALMVMGVHWLDGFRRLIDQDATWLTATTFSSPSVPAVGETDANLQIRFGDVTVTYTDSFSSWITQWDTIVLGDEGTLHITGGGIVLAGPGGTERIENPLSTGEAKPLTAYGALAGLLDAVETGVEAPNSGRDNLKTVSLIDGAYRSAETGAPIDLVDGLLP
ncbi:MULTISPECIES: Gfo/Idh/MocA family oxidoreductase [unclassified Rathayibacter]|uniref:Gfo/Idh/MocA family protein n=1 Tax=unclassified Rathayibacter TaxID=2609250 RepID=UPI0010463AE8|nr:MULTISPECIES: Gfo/Idh/MocA family oxidoreductase [unclassified Rathayibacter]MCJ1704159.1 Gfo/Idh/MocA family oxidoreductase [Rathayibacter sp. VKM Ac-2926]TCL83187.1 putative dehydrogenase [Rathayibacter sp. PhB192]TCM28685.1 putative dehydrogenase [Rathayibacter sp. PhB179]